MHYEILGFLDLEFIGEIVFYAATISKIKIAKEISIPIIYAFVYYEKIYWSKLLEQKYILDKEIQ